MSGHGEKITRKQEQAIAALLTHNTIVEAADSIEIGESTLRRWMKTPEFCQSFNAARKEAVSSAIIRIQTSANDAIKLLRSIMEREDAPIPSRVTAAKVILDQTLRAWEIFELEERIKTLEALVEMGSRR
jgi:hypothetical protein